MYEITYSPAALKSLEKLEKHTQERITLVLERLGIRSEFCDIKRLVGMPGYRFRVGGYRIIFDIDKNQSKIGHRKTVYGH